MKVTMLLSALDQTGMTTHTLDLAQALTAFGLCDVTLLVGYKEGRSEVADRLYKSALATGAKVRTFSPPNRNKLKSKLQSAASLLYNLLKISGGGGITHVQSPYLSWAPWLLRRKFVSTLHVNDLVRCIYYKNATHLIAISRETKQYAKDVFGYQDKDITIVHHGVSPRFTNRLPQEEIDRRKEQLNLPKDKILITLVGSIEPRKGHDILLKAIRQLSPDARSKIHVIFLGSDKSGSGRDQAWLKQVINDTHTEDLVTHFEYQDSELFYKLSDIFVLPSWLEGFPVVTIEALLSGCLCIRSDAEGAYEQIVDGETGYIFPKGDFDRLAAILEQLINDSSLRQRIAQSGTDYALSHFTSEIMARNTAKVYDALGKL